MSSRSERPRRRLLKWSVGIAAAIVILAAIAVGLFRVAANMVPGYHDEIVRRISAQIGAPVELGRISLAWHGWGPELQFKQLRVLNAKTGKVVLSAKRLRLDFSLLSLVHGTDARPSGIGLVAPRVTLQQTASGGFRVPGLSLAGGGGQFGAMLGMQLRVRDGTLKLRLADSAHTLWVFDPVNLRVGGGEAHAIHLSLGMPEPLGAGTLRVVGTLVTRESSTAQWEWRGSYALDKLALTPLYRFLPETWPRVSGELAFDGEAQGTGGRLESASGRVLAQDLAAGESRLKRVQTNFAITAGDGYEVTLTDALLIEPERRWKPGKVTFARSADGELHASVANLALAALPPLTGFLPASLAALGQRLHEIRPTGAIRNVKLAFTPGRIASLDLDARFDDVGVYAAEGAPGFDHLAGNVTMRHGAGIFSLDAPGFSLRMPHIFPHTVPLDRAVGRIGIAFTAEGIRVAMPGLRLTGPAGLDGTIMAEIAVPHAGPVIVNLAAQAAPIEVNPARALYLPTGMLPDELVAWLMHQLDGGRVSGTRMLFTGEAMRFPFKHGGGHFEVGFRFSGVTLKPGQDWAPIENLSGTVRFENAVMRADIGSGKIANAQVVEAHAVIPDLFDPQLQVTTEVAGTIPDFMAFLRASPIGGKLQEGFERFQAEGDVSTRLTLRLPIMHPKRFTLQGKLTLDDANVRYTGAPYTLENLAGTLNYDAGGPTNGQLEGRLLDTPVTIVLSREQHTGSGDKKLLRVAVDGRFTVATLSEVADYDFSRYASGTLPLHAELDVPLAGGGLPVTVNLFSPLDGLALKLPVPVGKSAIARRPFAARIRIGADGFDVAARYADVVSACAALADDETQPLVRAAEVTLGAGECETPVSGYIVNGGWRMLDAEPWLNELPPTPHGTGSTANFWPQESLNVNVRFGEIDVLGQRLRNQTIRGTLGAKQMKILFDGPDLAGRVLIPHKPDNSNPILAELTRGHFALPQKPVLAKSAASATGAPAAASGASATMLARAGAPATTQTPAPASRDRAAADSEDRNGLSPLDIPPFTLRAKHLELGTAALDDVLVSARRVPSGVFVKPIHIGGGALSLEGQLSWLDPAASGPQGALQFVAQVNSLGKFLEGLGLGPVITGHGALSAALAWREPRNGGEFAQGLLGKVSTDLRDGSISQVSPGAGRLLSLLSLVNIPRYLVFNFHNLFGEGFPYSRIHGDYKIRNGIARTQGLIIESSIAHIKLTGSVNLVAGTMDQTAEVEPNYFGSLPIIGAIVGGLGVGAVIYVLSKLFGNPLAEATKMTFSISGQFSDPVVKKLGGEPTPAPQRAPVPASAGHAG